MRAFPWALLALGALIAVITMVPSAGATPASRWSTPILVDPPTGATLESVSCPSRSLCVAADDNGNILTSTDAAARTPAWRIISFLTASGGSGMNPAGFTSVSCPSRSFCAATDSTGDVVTSTDPAGGRARWTLATIDSGAELSGVSCPTASLCVAIDSAGPIFTSTAPAGGAGAWQRTAVPVSDSRTAVSCASPSLCVAVDNGGRAVVSANPTGGRSAWSAVKVGLPSNSNDAAGVSCASAALCVTAEGNRIVTSRDPGGGASAWHVTKLPGAGLEAVSCPSASLCVAAGVNGDAVSSSRPTGAAGEWHKVRIADDAIPGLACVPRSYCVAVDVNGHAIASTEPGGPAETWSRTLADPIPTTLNSVSCPSPKLCVAGDDDLRLVTTTHPVGGEEAWRVLSVGSGFPGTMATRRTTCPQAVRTRGSPACQRPPAWRSTTVATWSARRMRPAADGSGADSSSTRMLTSISCASRSLCVAVDDAGDVVSSSDPGGG